MRSFIFGILIGLAVIVLLSNTIAPNFDASMARELTENSVTSELDKAKDIIYYRAKHGKDGVIFHSNEDIATPLRELGFVVSVRDKENYISW